MLPVHVGDRQSPCRAARRCGVTDLTESSKAFSEVPPAQFALDRDPDALDRIDEGVVVRGLGPRGRVAHRLREVVGLAVVVRDLLVSLPVGDPTNGNERLQPEGRRAVGKGEDPFAPAPSFPKMTAHLPEPPQRVGHPYRALGPPAVEVALERGAQVVVLELEAVEPALELLPLKVRGGLFGERHVRGGVAGVDRLRLVACGELLERVVADRDEHPESRLALDLELPDEAVIDQLRDPVQHRPPDLTVRSAHRLELVEPGASDEDAAPPEEPLQAIIEKVVAPADRSPKRPLTVGTIRRTRGQKIQTLPQPRQHRLRREELHPCSGELEGEG